MRQTKKPLIQYWLARMRSPVRVSLRSCCPIFRVHIIRGWGFEVGCPLYQQNSLTHQSEEIARRLQRVGQTRRITA